MGKDAEEKEANLEAINWKNTTVRLGDLKPWAANPKTITKAAAKRLLASWKEFGQVQTIAISPSLVVLDGHQRLNVLLAAHGADYQVDARQASRELSEDEQKRLVVTLHAGAVGSWDWDSLSSWSAPDLMEWGMDSEALQGWKRDVSALLNMLGSEGEIDENYSRNIQAPIYTPKGEKPSVKDLYDDKRANELLAEIEAADLPEDEKEFLRIAARRHTVLNYKRIADYYAHSTENVQKLMEDSALIIIDFERAIELGYVKLSQEIADQYLADYG